MRATGCWDVKPVLPLFKLQRSVIGNATVQPRSIDVVARKVLTLQQLNDVFDSRADVSTYLQFLQRTDHRPARTLAVLARGKNVAELRVSELVDASRVVHREVTPHIHRGAKLKVIYAPRCGLEALFRVLGCYAHSDAVTLWGRGGDQETQSGCECE